jgi:hypothetical protein
MTAGSIQFCDHFGLRANRDRAPSRRQFADAFDAYARKVRRWL